VAWARVTKVLGLSLGLAQRGQGQTKGNGRVQESGPGVGLEMSGSAGPTDLQPWCTGTGGAAGI